MDNEYHFTSSNHNLNRDKVGLNGPKTYQTISQNGNYCLDCYEAEANHRDSAKMDWLFLIILTSLLIFFILVLIFFTGYFTKTQLNSQNTPDAKQLSLSAEKAKSDFPLIIVEKIGEPFGCCVYHDRNNQSRILINRIIEDGPAEKAGLLEGDCLISMDDVEIHSIGDIHHFLRDKQDGEEVSIVYSREQNLYETTLSLTFTKNHAK